MTWSRSEKRRSAISSLRVKPSVSRYFHACAVEMVTPARSAESETVRVRACAWRYEFCWFQTLRSW